MAERCRASQRRRAEANAEPRQLTELKAKALQALGHPARLMILEALRKGERCVCEIGPALGLRQPNISQHLSVLRAANLVVSRRDGTRVLYSVSDPSILEIIDLMGEVVGRQGQAMAEAITQARQRASQNG